MNPVDLRPKKRSNVRIQAGKWFYQIAENTRDFSRVDESTSVEA